MPIKPSENEEEDFKKLEIQRRLQAQAQKTGALAEEEKKRLKELHYLCCPKCGTKLEEAVLEAVTVDICPGCHGVWLDEGELEKLKAGGKGFFGSLREVFE